MSDTTGIKTSTPNPSTYKQVLENMQSILTLFESMGNMSELPMTVEQMAAKVQELSDSILTPPPGGGAVTTPDGIKVIGIHSNTTLKDENTVPADYKQGMTLELKLAEAVGLGDKEDIVKPYIFILTFVQDTSLDSESAVPEGSFAPVQLAFADAAAVQYMRVAESGVWGEWKIQGDGTGDKQVLQIIQSETEPVDQPEGHYWCEPITEA